MGFSQKITDAMNNYSRSVTRQQMDEAPPELKYVYIGPVDEKTRPFCLEAAGAGPLTLDEINSLGGEWVESLSSGGGINCRHNWELASSDIKSQFHNGDEALKVLEGKLKRKEIAKWKPSMTKEVAKKFVKQSTIKDTIYHGTTVSASESIAKNGFSLQQTTTGRIFGDGVYLTTKLNDATNFSMRYNTGTTAVMPIKINVKKMFKFPTDINESGSLKLKIFPRKRI